MPTVPGISQGSKNPLERFKPEDRVAVARSLVYGQPAAAGAGNLTFSARAAKPEARAYAQAPVAMGRSSSPTIGGIPGLTPESELFRQPNLPQALLQKRDKLQEERHQAVLTLASQMLGQAPALTGATRMGMPRGDLGIQELIKQIPKPEVYTPPPKKKKRRWYDYVAALWSDD